MSADLVSESWSDLPARDRLVLEMRNRGSSLEDIGRLVDRTRERVRQIERSARFDLVAKLEQSLGLGDEWIGTRPDIFSSESVMQEFATTARDATETYLQAVGFRRCRGWGVVVPNWWNKTDTSLTALAACIVDDAPFSATQLAARGAELFPDGFPLQQLIRGGLSPLVEDINGAWIRKNSRDSDSAYVWLGDRTEPSSIESIASAIGAKSSRALAENLRRNSSRFFQLRPEGTWSVVGGIHAAQRRYSNATEAVIDTLSDLGPLDDAQLIREVIRRYPVTYSRVTQCFSSIDIGRNPDGRLDLVRRGAAPIHPDEPRRPSSIAQVGAKIAFKVPVNEELLRGSGLGISPWLTWRLGLHNYPSRAVFTGRFPVSIRRQSSGSAVSSLREAARSLDLRLGCELVVVLDTERVAATVRAACDHTGLHPTNDQVR